MNKEIIRFTADKYGGGSSANLGHRFLLSVNYPMISGEGCSGYVLGLKIGEFKTVTQAEKACSEIAIDIIKDLNKRFVLEKEGEQDE